MKMKRTPVDSSMIRDVGYDSETETLEIGFQTGGVYQYYEVPQDAFDELMNASSKGTYFLGNIEPFYVYAPVRQTRRGTR